MAPKKEPVATPPPATAAPLTAVATNGLQFWNTKAQTADCRKCGLAQGYGRLRYIAAGSTLDGVTSTCLECSRSDEHLHVNCIACGAMYTYATADTPKA